MPSNSDIKAFLAAIAARWFTLMSGALSVPATFAAVLASTNTAKVAYGFTALICLFIASYWPWREERKKAISIQTKLDDIGAKLSLAYHHADLKFSNNERQLHVEIIFENRGDFILKTQVIEILANVNNEGSTYRQIINFNIHPAEQRSAYAGFVGFSQFNPSVHTVITLGFTAHYDNIPPIRKRYCTRRITWEYSSLVPPVIILNTVNNEDDGFLD